VAYEIYKQTDIQTDMLITTLCTWPLYRNCKTSWHFHDSSQHSHPCCGYW